MSLVHCGWRCFQWVGPNLLIALLPLQSPSSQQGVNRQWQQRDLWTKAYCLQSPSSTSTSLSKYTKIFVSKYNIKDVYLYQMHKPNLCQWSLEKTSSCFLIMLIVWSSWIYGHHADPLNWQQHAIELEAHFLQPLETPSPPHPPASIILQTRWSSSCHLPIHVIKNSTDIYIQETTI